ncbi:Brix domain-containing protein [Gaertneriomyces semiglobifer]|nr:Brix domain-containing protein [Gaertneriomyces semiglobifer]
MLRTVKARTAAGKRALKQREPQVIEEAKAAVFVKGTTTSQLVTSVLKDLYALKRPDAVLFSKRNDVKPFEDPAPLEFFSQKNDAALFVLASHSKKRPHNLTFARTFDYQLLDMVEVGVVDAKTIDTFKTTKAAIGHRPLLVFSGDIWDTTEELQTLKSILLDMYRGNNSDDMVNLSGLEHVMCFTAESAKKVHLRTYIVQLKKSGTRLPRVELEEMGPSCEMTVGRCRAAAPDVWKQAIRVPQELKAKKEKNIERNEMGDQIGRIHMHKQDFSKLQTRKLKGLKRRADEDDDEEEDDDSAKRQRAEE